jgi:hypothetical protein
LVASKVPRFAFRNPHFPSGDRGLWSHGNKQLRERFVVDLKSQVQQASHRYRLGVALHQHSAFRIPQSAFSHGSGLLFTNIPRSAFLRFVICHLYGYWLLAIGLPALLFQK